MVAGVYGQHRALLSNAGSLFATTGVASILGAAYWTLAARLFGQQDVGYGAAEIPAMTLIGTIGMFGFGTLLVGELPKRKRRAELVSAALIVCALGSLFLGLAFVLIAPHFSGRFGVLISTPIQKAIFIAGVVLTSVSQVLDMATIGILRASIQLARNMAFSILKLAALPIFAATILDRFGVDVTLSWVVGMALSLAFVTARIAFSRARLLVRPDLRLLRSLFRSAMAHYWINIATTAPPTLFPVLVTVLISPSANAAFYVAFTLSTFLYVIPSQLSMVLFAMAAAEPQAIAHRVRFAMKLSYAIGLPAITVLILGSHWILGIYGPGYARTAAIPMLFFALGYIPAVPKALYLAICRANNRITYAAVILSAFTVAEIGGVAAGAVAGGLIGLSAALLATLTAQGIIITPLLLRATMRRGRHRTVAYSAVSSRPVPRTVHHVPEVPGPDRFPAVTMSPSKQQQEAGINALTALADAVGSPAPSPAVPLYRPARAWPRPQPSPLGRPSNRTVR